MITSTSIFFINNFSQDCCASPTFTLEFKFIKVFFLMESYRILFKSPSLADCPYIIIYLLLDLSSIFFSSSLCVYIYLSSRFYQNINSHIILFIYTRNWCNWLPLQFFSFFHFFFKSNIFFICFSGMLMAEGTFRISSALFL